MTCFPRTNQMMMLINIINTLYLTFGGIISVDKVSFYFNEQTDGLTDRKVCFIQNTRSPIAIPFRARAFCFK